MRQFGLIGYPLGHSFSKKYFTEKFEKEAVLDATYELFPIADINQLPLLIQNHPELRGLNVTIPYKESVLPYLDAIEERAANIGAVNCISISHGKKTGYNTDVIGFKDSLLQSAETRFMDPQTKAYILGTGGASKAVAYALKELQLPFRFVSRTPKNDKEINYQELETDLTLRKKNTENVQIIINCSPLGTYPNVDECPQLPFYLFGPEYFIFDLIYNPGETVLLREAKSRGCTTQNGMDMLIGQAEAAWKIWNQAV